MKKTFIIPVAGLFIISFFVTPVSALKFDFTTVKDIVNNVKKRYGEIECYSADFVLRSEKAGKKTQQSGSIKSKTPDKLLVEYSSPAGQRIVANDKTMWIYIPSMNVVAEQDLRNESASVFSSNTKSGLTRLFTKYHFKFDSKDQPMADPDGKKYYTIFLKQRESRGGYKSLKLWISEDFLIRKAQGETSSGKKIDIEFNNIKTNENFPNGIFKFDIPSQAQVVKNPMMAEE